MGEGSGNEARESEKLWLLLFACGCGRGMIVVNFSHSLTPEQVRAVESLTGRAVTRIIDAGSDFDQARPFAEQARALVDSVPLAPRQWQTEPLLVCLPSYNYAAALVLAELHGRAGHFPAALRLRPVAGTVPAQFEVAEILNLQAVRERARKAR